MSATKNHSSSSHSSSAPTRRLSSRRQGSISAPDPWGTFEENDRGVASVLHIVKAPSPSTEGTNDKNHQNRRRSQHGPLAGHARTQSAGSNRISFASSGRASPPSPDGSQRRRSYFTPIPRSELTAEQVIDFAQKCNSPSDGPVSPGGCIPSPVTFAEVPDEHYLPFVDRSSEVKDLISSFPTRKLFVLLAQTFSPDSPKGEKDNPVTWNYQQLESWLTETKREEVDDAEWVRRAGQCISNKSELIWERIKGALGIPPDLCDSSEDIIGPEMPEGEDAEVVDLEEDEVYIEPIISSPSPASPVGGFFGNEQARIPLEDISEDGPETTDERPTSPTICGLRVVNCPSSSPTRRFSIPRHVSSSQSRELYNAISERGPGNPLFPSNFGRLTLEPTLKANNPALRRLSIPASRFPQAGQRRTGRGSRSWAEGWDPTRHEYAVSTTSTSSIGPT